MTTNKSFQLDGHTGDWLFEGGVLRVRESGAGWTVIGTTRVVNSYAAETISGNMMGVAAVETGNTPRAYRALVGQSFATLGGAKHAIMMARLHYVAPSAEERLAELRARVEREHPSASPEAKEGIVQMYWARSRHRR